MRSNSRIGVFAALSVTLVTALATVACGGDGGSSGVCEATGTGTLVVAVVGLPASVTGKVTVTGPGGSQAVSGSQTFAGTAAGTYTVNAEKVTQSDPIVKTVYFATISSVTTCVSSGVTQTVTVTYGPIATSNKIWIAPSQLTVTTDPGNPTVPERVITSTNLGYGEDIALYPAPAALPLFSALP
ncbi:hypothetical protein BH09MYX1_BH09MYX1_63350 [soil metagenome]